MSNVTLYRVENEAGQGPYTTGCYVNAPYGYDEFASGAQNDPHPSPYSDGLPAMLDEERCAFPSVEALRAWFGHAEVIEQLREGGFYVNTYHVAVIEVPEEHVRHGGRQSLYLHSERIKIAEHSLDFLLEDL